MRRLSTEEINHIVSSVDIVDVVSNYVSLTPKGKNFFGVCPFHNDNHPSMSVSREKQIYTCFSCGATGTVVNFIEDFEHVSFIEALKIVADHAGISLDIGKVDKKLSNTNNPLYEIYDIASKFYSNNINTSFGKEAKDYLKERNIDEAIIKEFGIGLALKKHDMLLTLLTNKKFDMNLLMKSGLIGRNDYGYLDSYYNRIMFPLWDINGRVVGFSGRIFHGEEGSKYINSKESEIFKKGELLYNYHRAKDEARREDKIIIMEGFMDVIRANTIGIKNVIAMMGTAVTKEQATLIRRMAKEVILCFDGDRAGAKATLSCSEELLKLNVIPKIVRLEENLDPDEYISKYGKERFLGKLNNPMNVMDFKLSYLKQEKDLSSNQDVAKYVNDVLLELTKIDDEVLRELTLKKISEESNLEVEFLKSQLQEKQAPPKKIDMPKVVPQRKLNKYDKAQMYLLYYMLQNEEVIRLYNQKITFMPNEKYRNLAFHISYYYKTNGNINIASLMNECNENKDLLKTIGEIEQLRLKEEYTIEEIEDYLNTIKEYNIKNGQAELSQKLKNERDLSEKVKIAEEMIALKVRRENV